MNNINQGQTKHGWRTTMATLDGKRDGMIICDECSGNGFVRIPYSMAKEEVWANCDRCESQGEVILDELDDQTRR